VEFDRLLRKEICNRLASLEVSGFAKAGGIHQSSPAVAGYTVAGWKARKLVLLIENLKYYLYNQQRFYILLQPVEGRTKPFLNRHFSYPLAPLGMTSDYLAKVSKIYSYR
jgi:hypothetical protein